MAAKNEHPSYMVKWGAGQWRTYHWSGFHGAYFESSYGVSYGRARADIGAANCPGDRDGKCRCANHIHYPRED